MKNQHIITKTSYTTTDGNVFYNEEEANKHQDKLDEQLAIQISEEVKLVWNIEKSIVAKILMAKEGNTLSIKYIKDCLSYNDKYEKYLGWFKAPLDMQSSLIDIYNNFGNQSKPLFYTTSTNLVDGYGFTIEEVEYLNEWKLYILKDFETIYNFYKNIGYSFLYDIASSIDITNPQYNIEITDEIVNTLKKVPKLTLDGFITSKFKLLTLEEFKKQPDVTIGEVLNFKLDYETDYCEDIPNIGCMVSILPVNESTNEKNYIKYVDNEAAIKYLNIKKQQEEEQRLKLTKDLGYRGIVAYYTSYKEADVNLLSIKFNEHI